MSNLNRNGLWNETVVGKAIVSHKYLHEGETFDGFVNRVSGIYSDKIKNLIKEAMREGDLFGAGRTLYGAGYKDNRHVTMSNCFITTTPSDSLESIYDVNKESAIIGSYGGGVGICIDNLRPKNAPVNNSAKQSTGACSFMDLFNVTGGLIGQNNRHMAEMIALTCEHPDIEEFLNIKKSGNKLASANISIKFTDAFMKAVKNKEKFTLHFTMENGDRIEKEIDAYAFFKDFCETQYDWGDPGAIFIDTVRKNNLLAGYDDYKIDVSNPCVTGDTLILTENGYKPIMEMVNRKVKIWNGFTWSVVMPRVTGYNQKMLKISLSNGMSLKCTRYHKFVLNDGSRVKAEELSYGDILHKWEYPLIQGRKTYDDVYIEGYNLAVGSVPSCNKSVLHRVNWLAGIIDYNGSFSNYDNSILISSTDRDFLLQVQLMLTTLGCHSSVSLDKIMDYDTLFALTIGKKYVQKLVDLGLKLRKVDINFSNNISYEDNTIAVISIKEIDDENVVFCFNEPINHTGIFNGMMTGQCAEYFGNAGNSCLLESVNLYNCVVDPFTKNAYVDMEKVRYLTNLGVYQLNETLHYGYSMLPLELNRKCVDNWGSIGLGIFGLADMFVALGIKYGSDDSILLASDILATMLDEAVLTSAYIAKEKGSFGKFNLEKTMQSPLWDRLSDKTKQAVEKYGLANGTLLSIAPTGSIATMVGCSGGIEPMFAISYERTTHSSEDKGNKFRVFSQGVKDLLIHNHIPLDIPDEEVKKRFPFVVTTYDIAPVDRVRMQANIQKFVDNAISSTVNLPHKATVEDIEAIYMKAWEMGLKGITIFRDGCKRANILGVKKENSREGINLDILDTKKIPKRSNIKAVRGETFSEHTSCIKNMYVTVNKIDNKPMEILVSHVGGCQSNIATVSRLASAMLKLGVKIEDIAKELKEVPCQGCLTKRRDGNSDISTSCGGAIADALIKAHGEQKPLDAYMICPECGERKLRALGKCVQCDSCGYSKCD